MKSQIKILTSLVILAILFFALINGGSNPAGRRSTGSGGNSRV